jgi:hypothetical protein
MKEHIWIIKIILHNYTETYGSLLYLIPHNVIFLVNWKVHTEFVKYITQLETNNMEFHFTHISKSVLKYNYELLITT